MKRSIGLWAFFRDWVIIASLPITAAALVRAAVTSNGHTRVLTLPVPTEALLCYALALAYAFFDDAPINRWQVSGHRFLKFLAGAVGASKPLVTVVAALFIGALSMAHLIPDGTKVVGDDVFFVSAILIATFSLLLAFFVVLNSRPARRVAR